MEWKKCCKGLRQWVVLSVVINKRGMITYNAHMNWHIPHTIKLKLWNTFYYNKVVCLEMCSIAARRSCFILTKRRPFFQGFCRFRGLKSSLRHLSLFPMTATKQKFLSFSFSYRGPSLPFRMTAMFNCLMTRSTTSLAVVLVVTDILTLVPWARPDNIHDLD